MMGTIFATGLHTQCKEVESHIQKMLSLTPSSLFSAFSSSIKSSETKSESHSKIVVNLNVVGLSRGGIAAIQLAQMLHYITPDRLHLQLLLFDPVPGNLIGSSRYLDIFGMNTANSSLDMRKCYNLCDVLALYPYEPLPDLAFHAPVLPQYPPQCTVVEDATLGCHQGALFCSCRSLESRLSYFRIHEWLEKHGTKLYQYQGNTTPDATTRTAGTLAAMTQGNKLGMTPQQCKDLMDEIMLPPNREIAPIVRYTHSLPPGAVITLHGMSPSDTVQQDGNLNSPSGCVMHFLNKHHQELSERLNISSAQSKTSTGTSTKGTSVSDSASTTAENNRVQLFLEICRPDPTIQTMFSSTSLLRSCST